MANDSVYISFNLDREQLDLILVAVLKRRKVPVQINVAAFELKLGSDFASRDTTVSDLEGDSLAQVVNIFPISNEPRMLILSFTCMSSPRFARS